MMNRRKFDNVAEGDLQYTLTRFCFEDTQSTATMLISGVRDSGSVLKNLRTRSQGVIKSEEDLVASSLMHCVTKAVLGVPVIADFVSGRKYAFRTIPCEEKSKPGRC